MGGGTDRVPPNDYGTNLGREEEKILTGKEKTLQKKVHGEVCLDGAVVVIDRMTREVGETRSALQECRRQDVDATEREKAKRPATVPDQIGAGPRPLHLTWLEAAPRARGLRV